jgi:hypothetical protein
MYFPIDYYRFQNYRNIGAVFVSDNIVSILFSRKRCENESDLPIDRFRSFSSLSVTKKCCLLGFCMMKTLGLLAIWLGRLAPGVLFLGSDRRPGLLPACCTSALRFLFKLSFSSTLYTVNSNKPLFSSLIR